MPAQLLLGFAGVAAISLAGYDCFLRTEEMYLLRVEDVAFEQGRANERERSWS